MKKCFFTEFSAVTISRTKRAVAELMVHGFDQDVAKELVMSRRFYGRIAQALAGGKAAQSVEQMLQGDALRSLDVNREIFMRDQLKKEKSAASSSHPYRNEALRKLVRDASEILKFRGLPKLVDSWISLRPDAEIVDHETKLKNLTDKIGLFHTNAQRFLNAFEHAETTAHTQGGTVQQCLPACLARQWMHGPGEQERELLQDKTGVEVAEFHRKLTQQYAMLCHSFGLPLPAMAELVLIDTGEQAATV